QLKHHMDESALTDASPDLWKTLRIWSTDFSRDTPESLFIVTTAVAASESGVSLLRRDGRDVTAAFVKLCDAMKHTKNRANEPGVTALQSLSPSNQLALLDKVTIIDQSPKLGEIEEKLKQSLHFVAEDSYRDELIAEIEGWWLRRVVLHLKDR